MSSEISTDVQMTDASPLGIIQNEPMSIDSQVSNEITACEYLKDGKLNFVEPKLRAENHAFLAEKILKYRVYRAKLESTDETAQNSFDVPAEYMDVIAALVQDSDEPLKFMTGRINDILSPFLRNEKLANKFEAAIERAIRSLAHRSTYGLKQDIYLSIDHTAPNIPWHLNINRWEIEDLAILPTDMQQAVTARRNNRVHMTDVFSNFILNLPQEERNTIVNTKHRKLPGHKEFTAADDTKPKQPVETEQEREEKRLKKEEEKKRRDEERKLRDEEKRVKDEERKLREEEKKRIREEEKRVKDEERKKREDEKKKKEQSQLRLTSLFTKTVTPDVSPYIEQKIIEPTKPTLFPAFYIKDHVSIVSPTTNLKTNNDTNQLNQFIHAINSQSTVSIKDFVSTLPAESKQKRGISTHVDIRKLLLPGSADMMHAPNVRSVLRMKLLHFSENVRPAYYGTFTKRSSRVKGTSPFAQDNDILDYDVDSEAEWEPEGEGEDINSDEEDEDPAETIDPEDAGWLVPEGYLSDSEGVEDEEDDERISKKLSTYPQKSHSRKNFVRKIVLGPFFEGEAEEDEVMKPFETTFFMDIGEEGYNPFYKEPSTKTTASNNTNNNSTDTPPHNVKFEFKEEHTNALISVINDKPKDSIPNLINEAKATVLLKDVSKRQLEAKIKDIAVKEKRGSDTRPSWYIKDPNPSSKTQ